MDTAEAKLYAAAFRRAGSALMRRPSLKTEEFRLAFAAMAAGFRDHADEEASGSVISAIWEAAAAAYADAQKNGLPLSGCLQAAHTAAQDRTRGITRLKALAISSSLVIRSMRDALE